MNGIIITAIICATLIIVSFINNTDTNRKKTSVIRYNEKGEVVEITDEYE